jgi:hypothetical protein
MSVTIPFSTIALLSETIGTGLKINTALAKNSTPKVSTV